MTAERKRLLLALSVTPLAGSIPFVATALYGYATSSVKIESWWVEMVSFFVVMFFAALPWYIAGVAVLLPMHLALRRYAIFGLIAYQVAFAVLANLLFLLLFPVPEYALRIIGPMDTAGWLIQIGSAIAIASAFWAMVVCARPR